MFRLLLLVIILCLAKSTVLAQQFICGCSDIQDVYPYNPGTLKGSHFYDVGQVVICNTRQEGCTEEFVYEIMLSDVSFAAPTEQHLPVNDCETYRVTFMGGLGGGGITIKLDETQFKLTNYTRKDHDLHPGKVVRQVQKKANGDIIVRSVGAGSGILPSLNNYKAPGLWAEVEERLRKDVQQKLPKPETVPFPANSKALFPSKKRAEVGDLIIIEVENTANLGTFTTDVRASGRPTGRQHYNKPQYANLNHGVVIIHQGGKVHPCLVEPYNKLLSMANQMAYGNGQQPDGTIFLATQAGDIQFELNDNKTDDNWDDFEVMVKIVPFSQHRGKELQTAYANYLKTFK